MIIAAVLLTVLGIVVIYSSSPTQAYQQALLALVGLISYLFISRFDYRVLKSFSWLLYIVVIILLLVVFGLGIETRGSVRWIPLGAFNMQPSELAKFVLILVLAFFWQKRTTSWLNIGISLLITAPFFLLIFKQPDLGTSLTIGFIWLSILVAANLSFLKMMLMSIFVLLIGPFGWQFLQPYQKQRLTSFLVPNHDPLGIGFHVIQSQIAVGSGQIFGRGLGRGTQSRLQFLPEFRTDFIFAFIAEELGFLGAIIVVSLYGVILYFCIQVINKTNDRLGALLASGVVGMLIFQIVVNIGMNIGIMPVTGITLPLLSYGGSSMFVTYVCLGLIESIKRFKTKDIQTNNFSLI